MVNPRTLCLLLLGVGMAVGIYILCVSTFLYNGIYMDLNFLPSPLDLNLFPSPPDCESSLTRLFCRHSSENAESNIKNNLGRNIEDNVIWDSSEEIYRKNEMRKQNDNKSKLSGNKNENIKENFPSDFANKFSELEKQVAEIYQDLISKTEGLYREDVFNLLLNDDVLLSDDDDHLSIDNNYPEYDDSYYSFKSEKNIFRVDTWSDKSLEKGQCTKESLSSITSLANFILSMLSSTKSTPPNSALPSFLTSLPDRSESPSSLIPAKANLPFTTTLLWSLFQRPESLDRFARKESLSSFTPFCAIPDMYLREQEKEIFNEFNRVVILNEVLISQNLNFSNDISPLKISSPPINVSIASVPQGSTFPQISSFMPSSTAVTMTMPYSNTYSESITNRKNHQEKKENYKNTNEQKISEQKNRNKKKKPKTKPSLRIKVPKNHPKPGVDYPLSRLFVTSISFEKHYEKLFEKMKEESQRKKICMKSTEKTPKDDRDCIDEDVDNDFIFGLDEFEHNIVDESDRNANNSASQDKETIQMRRAIKEFHKLFAFVESWRYAFHVSQNPKFEPVCRSSKLSLVDEEDKTEKHVSNSSEGVVATNNLIKQKERNSFNQQTRRLSENEKEIPITSHQNDDPEKTKTAKEDLQSNPISSGKNRENYVQESENGLEINSLESIDDKYVYESNDSSSNDIDLNFMVEKEYDDTYTQEMLPVNSKIKPFFESFLERQVKRKKEASNLTGNGSKSRHNVEKLKQNDFNDDCYPRAKNNDREWIDLHSIQTPLINDLLIIADSRIPSHFLPWICEIIYDGEQSERMQTDLVKRGKAALSAYIDNIEKNNKEKNARKNSYDENITHDSINYKNEYKSYNKSMNPRYNASGIFDGKARDNTNKEDDKLDNDKRDKQKFANDYDENDEASALRDDYDTYNDVKPGFHKFFNHHFYGKVSPNLNRCIILKTLSKPAENSSDKQLFKKVTEAGTSEQIESYDLVFLTSSNGSFLSPHLHRRQYVPWIYGRNTETNELLYSLIISSPKYNNNYIFSMVDNETNKNSTSSDEITLNEKATKTSSSLLKDSAPSSLLPPSQLLPLLSSSLNCRVNRILKDYAVLMGLTDEGVKGVSTSIYGVPHEILEISKLAAKIATVLEDADPVFIRGIGNYFGWKRDLIPNYSVELSLNHLVHRERVFRLGLEFPTSRDVKITKKNILHIRCHENVYIRGINDSTIHENLDCDEFLDYLYKKKRYSQKSEKTGNHHIHDNHYDEDAGSNEEFFTSKQYANYFLSQGASRLGRQLVQYEKGLNHYLPLRLFSGIEERSQSPPVYLSTFLKEYQSSYFFTCPREKPFSIRNNSLCCSWPVECQERKGEDGSKEVNKEKNMDNKYTLDYFNILLKKSKSIMSTENGINDSSGIDVQNNGNTETDDNHTAFLDDAELFRNDIIPIEDIEKEDSCCDLRMASQCKLQKCSSHPSSILYYLKKSNANKAFFNNDNDCFLTHPYPFKEGMYCCMTSKEAEGAPLTLNSQTCEGNQSALCRSPPCKANNSDPRELILWHFSKKQIELVKNEYPDFWNIKDFQDIEDKREKLQEMLSIHAERFRSRVTSFGYHNPAEASQ